MPSDSDEPDVPTEILESAGTATDTDDEDDWLLLAAGFVLMPILLRRPGQRSG